MKKYLFILSIIIASSLFLGFYMNTPGGQDPPAAKNYYTDTCYYYLSGSGITSGLTIMDILPFDCKCKFDSVARVLSIQLKKKYPDEYFMLENRKINGPFKKMDEAQKSILDLIKNYNVTK